MIQSREFLELKLDPTNGGIYNFYEGTADYGCDCPWNDIISKDLINLMTYYDHIILYTVDP